MYKPVTPAPTRTQPQGKRRLNGQVGGASRFSSWGVHSGSQGEGVWTSSISHRHPALDKGGRVPRCRRHGPAMSGGAT